MKTTSKYKKHYKVYIKDFNLWSYLCRSDCKFFEEHATNKENKVTCKSCLKILRKNDGKKKT